MSSSTSGDEISKLLSQVQSLHCPKGHTHGDGKHTFRVTLTRWCEYDVAEVLSLNLQVVQPAHSPVSFHDDAAAMRVVRCSCGEQFSLPDSAEVWYGQPPDEAKDDVF